MEIKDPLDAKATFPIVIMSMGNKKSPMAVCRYLLRMDVQLAMFGLDVAGLLLEPFVKFQSIATRKKHFYNARAPPVVYKSCSQNCASYSCISFDSSSKVVCYMDRSSSVSSTYVSADLVWELVLRGFIRA